MGKDWLLPHSFRSIGWILFVLFSVIGFADLYGVFTSKLVGEFTDEIAAIGVIVGLLFIAFSRLKVEDEMIQILRLKSLQMSIYINYIILALSILFFYDLDFFKVLVYNMFTVLIMFIIHFSWSLHKLKSSTQSSV